MPHVVMIDNYDSFTWNIYEYLCQEGARVDVFRNDKITLNEIEKINPDILLISPGPGHPSTDSGISCDLIERFKGKKPIFGVCMGEQCIYQVFGGKVEYAGEIVHGKTSPIYHDGKGIFSGVPQGVATTRYHSLAGTNATLPDCLEVTATTQNGVIMGIRHKDYAIEGVQFHPESILTEEGHLMIKNMLNCRDGFWKEDSVKKTSVEEASLKESCKKKSILDTIFEKRQKDVEALSQIPGKTMKDLETYLQLGLAPESIPFYDRLSSVVESGKSAILSEIKRASPSKADIDLTVNAAQQAFVYAKAGAAAISVLTEPTWFKGSLEDLRVARLSVERVENRPAILRKEFIFSEYQILEARLNGADTVLLIVKMLPPSVLDRLYKYSKKLGMEPLVEINSSQELEQALVVGSKVIGVNNRNLHNFQVDLSTSTRMAEIIAERKMEQPIILCALSGITSVDDVKKYKGENVNSFLIGEALMRKGDKVEEFIRELVNAK